MILQLCVWIARLLVGGTFVVSGMTKMVDLYGSVNKFNDYFAAWGLTDVFPDGLVLLAAAGLAMAEFLTGFTLLTGSMRRTSAVCASAIMAFMLPLSAYIWAASPVEDCGCFGEWLIISNAATFWKNVVLTALCVFLLKFNRRAACLFAPWVQWMEIAVAAAYCGCIGMIGYDEQPLLDFRPYPVGSHLVAAPDSEEVAPTYVYRSTATGELLEFGIYDLPEDELGLEFVEVKEDGPSVASNNFAILDPADGRDITDEVVEPTDSDMVFLLIPDLAAADAGISYNANELAARTNVIALTDASAAEIDAWRDISMADYPIYAADSRTLKTIARGKVAVVMTRGGEILWKRTLQSIDPAVADLGSYASPSGPGQFRHFTLAFLIIEAAICLLGLLPHHLRRLLRKRAG